MRVLGRRCLLAAVAVAFPAVVTAAVLHRRTTIDLGTDPASGYTWGGTSGNFATDWDTSTGLDTSTGWDIGAGWDTGWDTGWDDGWDTDTDPGAGTSTTLDPTALNYGWGPSNVDGPGTGTGNGTGTGVNYVWGGFATPTGQTPTVNDTNGATPAQDRSAFLFLPPTRVNVSDGSIGNVNSGADTGNNGSPATNAQGSGNPQATYGGWTGGLIPGTGTGTDGNPAGTPTGTTSAAATAVAGTSLVSSQAVLRARAIMDELTQNMELYQRLLVYILGTGDTATP